MFMRRNSIPELAGLTRDQKNKVWRRAYLIAFREPWSWFGLGCFAILYFFGRAVAGMTGGMVCAILGALIWLQFHTQAARPWCERVREHEFGEKADDDEQDDS